MPELPEVEITRRGIAGMIGGKTVTEVHIRNGSLRWPVDANLAQKLVGHEVLRVERRGKYLLLGFSQGTLIIHLGMSGFFRLLKAQGAPGRHDHIDLVFDGDLCLRYNDTRRFGAFLWTDSDPSEHPLLKNLGPEPLGASLDGAYFFKRSRGGRGSVKNFLMDQTVVAGVGNIYASETLFQAGILPDRRAGDLDSDDWNRLVAALKDVLSTAVTAGIQTLDPFFSGDADVKLGYFPLKFKVYDRQGEPCPRCGTPLARFIQGGRASYFCPGCQR